MAGEFHREYLVRLPLPLAQLYSRAYNAKDPRSRHDNTFYLLEALVKLTVAPLASAYLEDAARGSPRVPEIDQLLGQLTMPSLGQWVGMLRELARHRGKQAGGSAGTAPLSGIWAQLDEPRRDLPGLLALFRRIKNGADGEPAGDKSCSLLQVFDSLVQYRNGVFGHGAGRFESFYAQEMGPLLFPAVNDILGEGVLNVLGPRGSRLVYLTDLAVVDEQRVDVGMRELVGLQSERMTPLRVTRAEAAELAPHRVAVVWPGRVVPLRLDPILFYKETELAEELMFLNRGRPGRHIEYLSYATGRTERDAQSAASMAALLAQLPSKWKPEPKSGDSSTVEPPSEAAAEAAAQPSRMLGDYEILAEIGRGGMGVVYLARQTSLGRLVALKTLPAELANDEIALARFRREVRHLARCEHPNIVKVLSSGTMSDGQLYYTMEYVPGSDLELVWRELSGTHRQGDATSLGSTSFARAVIAAASKRRAAATRSGGRSGTKAGPLPAADGTAVPSGGLDDIPELALPPLPGLPSHVDDPGGYIRRVVALMRDAALALQAVHDQQIVHRDIKPGNLMLTPDGSRIVLMDFGLAKGQAMEPSITRHGGLQGTLRYAAPEQLAAAKLKVGPAADIRGLGVSLWELLTRKRLFEEADDEMQLAAMIYERDVPRLRAVDPSIDRDLEAIVARATERRAADRIQTAGQLAEYLDLYLQGQPLPIRPPTTAEMLGRWVRAHRPLVASAGATALIVLVTAVTAFVMITHSRNRAITLAEENEQLAKQEAAARQQAEAARSAAVDALKREEVHRKRAETALDEAEHNLYLSQMLQAHREWRENNVRRAREMLAICPRKARQWEWYYLNRLYAGGRLTIDAHEGGAECVAVLPDGKRIVSGGADKRVKVWDLTTGKLLEELKDGGNSVRSVAASPDGRWLAAAGDDRDVRVWDAKQLKLTRTLQGPTSAVTAVAFSPDSRRLAAASRDQRIRLWDVEQDAPPVEMTGYDNPLLSLAFHRSGNIIFGGGRSAYVDVWQPRGGDKVAEIFSGDPFFIYSLACRPDGSLLAIGNLATRVYVLDSGGKDGERLLTLSKGDDKVYSVAFSPDGAWLASGGASRTVYVYESYRSDGEEKWRQRSVFQGHVDAVTGVAFATGGHELISASRDGTIKVWPLVESLTGHTDGVAAVASRPDGGELATASFDGTLRLWNTKTRRHAVALSDHASPVNCVAYSPDGKRLTSGDANRRIIVWDAASHKPLRTLKGHEAAVLGVAFSPDGRLVASAGDDKTVRLWTLDGDSPPRTLDGCGGGATCVAFTPDGRRVIAGCRDHKVRIWNIADGKLLETLPGHNDTVWCLTVSNDGRYLVTGGWDKSVRVWELGSGSATREKFLLSGHLATIAAVALTPNGQRIVSSDGEGVLKIWETATGREVLTAGEGGPSYLGLAFGPGAKYLALAADDKRVYLWPGVTEDGAR